LRRRLSANLPITACSAARPFLFIDTAVTDIYTLSLHDALPIFANHQHELRIDGVVQVAMVGHTGNDPDERVIGDFPSMAATAWYWEKIPRDRTVAEVFEDAAEIGRAAGREEWGARAGAGASWEDVGRGSGGQE